MYACLVTLAFIGIVSFWLPGVLRAALSRLGRRRE
jgi:hypothetical protein